MHELSIAESLRDTILEWRRKNTGSTRALRARLIVGLLSGVDTESLLGAWEIACAAPGTDPFLESCRLVVSVPPLKYHCDGCGKDFENNKFVSECPFCSGEKLLRSGGRELTLQDIEVE